MAEYTAPTVDSEYVEGTGPTTESEFEEISGPSTESEVPVVTTKTVSSVEDEVEPSSRSRPDDLSVYIGGDGTYNGPKPVVGGINVATLSDLKKVYSSLDSCKTVDEIAASTALARGIVVECVQALINDYHLISQDDDRFCNIAAVANLQGQFDKICVACSKR